MFPVLVLSVCLAVSVYPAGAGGPGAPDAFGLLQAQVQRWPGPYAREKPRPYDRGNCFHWQGCRGESLGAMWIHAPDFCAALGGRSWMDRYTGRCHNLPPGPRGLMGL